MRNGLTQTEMVLELLKDGIGLSPIEALTECGCFRLAARIGNLVNEGYEVCSIWEESTNGFGESKRYKRYFLVA